MSTYTTSTKFDVSAFLDKGPTAQLRELSNAYGVSVLPDVLSPRSIEAGGIDWTLAEMLAAFHVFLTVWSQDSTTTAKLRSETFLGIALGRGQQALSQVMSGFEPTYTSWAPSSLQKRILDLYEAEPEMVAAAARDAYKQAILDVVPEASVSTG